MSARQRFQFSRLGITQGALIILGIEIGLSLVFMLCDEATQVHLVRGLATSPSQVFDRGYVWTLATSSFLQPELINLLFDAVMMFLFVPTLERFWGTSRFLRFFAITTLVGMVVGVTVGKLIGSETPLLGLSRLSWASVVAFGVIYARQPVQFFGVLPLTGRQMMLGFLGFLILFVLLGQRWAEGASFAGAMGAAAIMVSKRWSPGLAWKRWKIARARAKLTVMQGGRGGSSPKPDEQKWLN